MRRGVEGLKSILGKEKVIDDPAVVSLYSREPSGLAASAAAVVFPESTSDVSKLVSFAFKHEIKLFPQGSTTALSGSAVPEEGGIVVSFERMNRILGVSVVDSLVDVEPGVRIGDLNVELARHGYMFPIDPGSVTISTIGGAINAGAGGLRGAKYGTTRDWVLGLTAVLPDESGTVLRLGCRTTKCRQGYDLVRLLVGSEGTLAMVTEATLRIAPLPEGAAVSLAFFKELEDLFEAYREIKESRIQPLILEFMDHETTLLAKEASGAKVEAEGHMLLAAIDCNREAVDRFADWLARVMERRGAIRTYIARSMEEAEAMGLFTLRRSLFPAQVFMGQRSFPGRKLLVLLEDIAVPPSRLLDAVREIREVSRDLGLKVSIGGHVGDGNLHPSTAFPLDDERLKAKVVEWHEKITKIAIKLGGTVSAEHGIGLLKKEPLRQELAALGSERAIALMREIKRVFDPKNILNPGKVI